MEYLRTPDEHFENLPDYSFKPCYVQVKDGVGGELRVHYIDEGPRDGEVILMMHGEPSWTFLYRKMVKQLAEAGFRAIAVDLVGFGRSDKPTKQSDYSYKNHIAWMQDWFDQMQLSGITLYCQDWGGLIGLRLLTANQSLFARLIVANTFLPTGENEPSEAFKAWLKFSQEVPEFPTGGIISGATSTDLSNDVISAYNAPYPDETYKAGARQFPLLVPISTDNPEHQNNVDAWDILKQWTKPVLTAFSDNDPITKGADVAFQKLIPGANGQPHTTIENGGHFLQEDQPDQIIRSILTFIEKNPLA